MVHGSLFSGIGGFDLAARWMGWENALQCEIDPFCQKVLRYHFPSAQLYGDIKELDGTQWRGKIDILTGGFPCQPFSAAGRRRGQEDDRFLWPQMLRVIREISPKFIVGENVAGLSSSDEGMVFEKLYVDLEDAGYTVAPSLTIPACAIGAPHRRDRIWIVAANTQRERLQRFVPHKGVSSQQETPQPQYGDGMFGTWDTVARGIRGVCSLDGFSPAMVRRGIKAYGNAIVPQIAYKIFQAIAEAESFSPHPYE